MRLPSPYIARPIYELLPVVYLGVGLSLLALSYFRTTGVLAGVLGLAGLCTVLYGLVIALRRRDFRAMRGEYDASPLSDRDSKRID